MFCAAQMDLWKLSWQAKVQRTINKCKSNQNVSLQTDGTN